MNFIKLKTIEENRFDMTVGAQTQLESFAKCVKIDENHFHHTFWDVFQSSDRSKPNFFLLIHTEKTLCEFQTDRI